MYRWKIVVLHIDKLPRRFDYYIMALIKYCNNIRHIILNFLLQIEDLQDSPSTYSIPHQPREIPSLQMSLFLVNSLIRT